MKIKVKKDIGTATFLVLIKIKMFLE